MREQTKGEAFSSKLIVLVTVSTTGGWDAGGYIHPYLY